MLRFANQPTITISPSPHQFSTAAAIALPSSNSSNNQQQQMAMITTLGNHTGESHEKCLRYLIFFGWNFELAYKATVLWCQELCERTKITSAFFARRILEEAQFDIVLCQARLELVLNLMNRTNLIHVFAYDCLEQYQWNFNSALQRVFELASMNRLPANAFSTTYLQVIQQQQQQPPQNNHFLTSTTSTTGIINNNNGGGDNFARSSSLLQSATYHNQSRRNLFSF